MLGQVPRVDRDVTIHDYTPGQAIPPMVRDPRTGKVVVNELKRYVKPYTMVTDQPTITLAANAISDPIPMLIDNKGHFEVYSAFFTSQRAEGFTVKLFDAKGRPILMNREVHVGTIASGGGVNTGQEVFTATTSAGRPFVWPESFFMNSEENGTMIVAQFRNLSSSQNVIRFGLHGLRWYHLHAPDRIAQRIERIYRDKVRTMPFFYTTEQRIVLTGSGTASEDMRFTDEAWTEWVKSMRVSTGRFNCRIIEKASRKRFMEIEVRDTLVFGNGEFPFLMWEPVLFEPNYKLTFELTDLSGSSNTIWITLGCRKILSDPQETQLARPGTSWGGE